MPNVLRIKTGVDGHRALTTILVDEFDLLLLHEQDTGHVMLPADPVTLLPPDSAVLLGGPTPTFAMVGICTCGEPGDSSLWLQVRLVDDVVLWEPWPDSPRQTISRTYGFDLLPYLEAVALGAQTVTAWEERPRILARELRRRRDSLFGLPLGLGITLTGARAWPGVDEISVEIAGRHGGDFFRHPVSPDLSDEEIISGISMQAARRPRPSALTPDELLTLITAGPDLPVRGRIRTHVEGGDRLSGHGWATLTALTSGGGLPEVDVWRDGPRLRVQPPDGPPVLVLGDEGAGVPPSATGAASPLVAQNLLTRAILSGAVDRTAGVRLGPYVFRSELLGRSTWKATLQRPDGLEQVHLEVDTETGLVLSARTDSGSIVEWTSIVVGGEIDPAVFTGDGPLQRTADEYRALREATRDEHQHRLDWFTDHVLAGPLHVGLVLDLTSVPELDEESGALTASFGRSSVVLRRGPRPARLWHATGQRWTTDRWNWAVHVAGGSLPPDTLTALQAQLPDR